MSLRRYPVKSLGGETLERAAIVPGGLAFDRRFALVESSGDRAGKPLTARQSASMLVHHARVADDRVVVECDGSTLSIEALADEAPQRFGRDVTLREDDGIENKDDAAILVLLLPTLRAMELEFGAPLDVRRFRPNIVLDGDDADALSERAWAGRSFRAGTAVLRADTACVRCVLPTIDPDTTAVDPQILRFLVERHDTIMGTYCAVERPGSVSVGDLWEPIG